MMRTSTRRGVVSPSGVNSRSWITRRAHLRFRWDVADLVEKDRATVGNFKQTFLRGHRAGERAARVTKQLRFEQLLKEYSNC